MKIVVNRWNRPDRLQDRGHFAKVADTRLSPPRLKAASTPSPARDPRKPSGAQVVIDLAKSPSFEDKVVLEFFETAGRNLFPAEAAARVRHHVALSIVAIDRTDNGYFRAKVAQQNLIKASGIPYTIIRATSSWNSSAA
jgi:uncharacterized protein YbjT (DUF2867 family)